MPQFGGIKSKQGDVAKHTNYYKIEKSNAKNYILILQLFYNADIIVSTNS
jgi:hypothetical protein